MVSAWIYGRVKTESNIVQNSAYFPIMYDADWEDSPVDAFDGKFQRNGTERMQFAYLDSVVCL